MCFKTEIEGRDHCPKGGALVRSSRRPRRPGRVDPAAAGRCSAIPPPLHVPAPSHPPTPSPVSAASAASAVPSASLPPPSPAADSFSSPAPRTSLLVRIGVHQLVRNRPTLPTQPAVRDQRPFQCSTHWSETTSESRVTQTTSSAAGNPESRASYFLARLIYSSCDFRGLTVW